MEELQQGAFGPIYTQFIGKPKEAIKFLRQQQKGECIAALHRDDNGNTKNWLLTAFDLTQKPK